MKLGAKYKKLSWKPGGMDVRKSEDRWLFRWRHWRRQTPRPNKDAIPRGKAGPRLEGPDPRHATQGQASGPPLLLKTALALTENLMTNFFAMLFQILFGTFADSQKNLICFLV